MIVINDFNENRKIYDKQNLIKKQENNIVE